MRVAHFLLALLVWGLTVGTMYVYEWGSQQFQIMFAGLGLLVVIGKPLMDNYNEITGFFSSKATRKTGRSFKGFEPIKFLISQTEEHWGTWEFDEDKKHKQNFSTIRWNGKTFIGLAAPGYQVESKNSEKNTIVVRYNVTDDVLEGVRGETFKGDERLDPFKNWRPEHRSFEDNISREEFEELKKKRSENGQNFYIGARGGDS